MEMHPYLMVSQIQCTDEYSYQEQDSKRNAAQAYKDGTQSHDLFSI